MILICVAQQKIAEIAKIALDTVKRWFLWYNSSVDKQVFRVTVTGDNDASYWKQKNHMERLEALEQLRRINYGYDPSTARLQRTLTVTYLKKN